MRLTPIAIYRAAVRLEGRGWRWVLPWLRTLNLMLFSCEISFSAKIGCEFLTPHPIGIVIGRGVKIGDRVTLMQNVTLGQRYRFADDLSDYPTIEDDVEIGVGAVVLGHVTIGRGAKIGANAVVLTDVPPNASAVGIPAKVVKLSSAC